MSAGAPLPLALALFLLAAGCGPAGAGATGADAGGGSGATDGGGATATDGGRGGTCTLTAHTTPTGNATGGCALLDRDTSGCRAARIAEGLSGFWLKFSCRVSLTVVTQGGARDVEMTSDAEPDYRSTYFPSSSPCHADYTPAFPDPNHIVAQHLTLTIPLTPSGSGGAMGLGPVGMAVNGVPIFDDQAAPGADIFKESGSFDRCRGHPQKQGMYHYHTEPYAISHDDDRFIGVLRDGNPLYGRLDTDGSLPTLDADGGHVSVTPDSPRKAVYHYHVNLQTSTHPGTRGDTAWFLTTGRYHNTPN